MTSQSLMSQSNQCRKCFPINIHTNINVYPMFYFQGCQHDHSLYELHSVLMLAWKILRAFFWQQKTQTNAFQSKTMHPLYMFTRQQLQTQSLSLFQDLVVLGHKRVACLEIFQSFLTLLLPLGSFQLPLLADLGEQLHLLFK